MQRWTLRRLAIALGALVVVVVLALNWARLFANDNTRTSVHVQAACDLMEPMWLQAQAVQRA